MSCNTVFKYLVHVAITLLLSMYMFFFMLLLHFILSPTLATQMLRCALISFFLASSENHRHITMCACRYLYTCVHTYIINPLCITLAVCLPRLSVYQLTASVCVFVRAATCGNRCNLPAQKILFLPPPKNG